jgi:RimJ/RimL family protein N-acetyltransferase
MGEVPGSDDGGATALQTPRLVLEPLRVAHAEEMAPLLDDARLHTYTGGRPSTLAELQARYRRQSLGRSPDGRQRWLNWIVRRRQDGVAVGFVQATVDAEPPVMTAELAWKIGVAYQRQGYAGEAAARMAQWLRAQGVKRLVARIHPDNVASMAVARGLGLAATGELRAAEMVWASSPRVDHHERAPNRA